MSKSLNRRWKEFILNEGITPDVGVWLQSLKENIGMLRAHSMKENKRIELMRHQLNEIRKGTNRLLRENQILQEENKILQEKKDNVKQSTE